MRKLCWNFAWGGSSMSFLSEEHLSYTKLPKVFLRQNIFACLFSVHIIINLSRHGQV